MVRNSVVTGDRRRHDLFGVPGVPGVPVVDRRKPRSAVSSITVRGAWLLAVLIAVWAVASFALPELRVSVYTPTAQVGVESASTLARLFGALVLFLFPTDRGRDRLRWIAAGFVVMGLGGMVFGYLLPIFGLELTLNTSMYASLAVRTGACLCFVLALMSEGPPKLTRRSLLYGSALIGLISIAAAVLSGDLPPLVHTHDLRQAATERTAVLHGLTAWHWALSLFPLTLSILAVGGTMKQYCRRVLGAWLVVAMVLLAGSQLFALFWPSTYSPILTTSDLLRFAFAAAVTVGAIVELQRIASQRAMLLAAEREQSRRLADLNVLKANFTAMVAHELGSPLAAIRAFAHILTTQELSPTEQAEALDIIHKESETLTALVADVHQAATVELDDFAVQLRPMRLRQILVDATSFVKTLPGNHPLTTPIATQELVWADPDRIGQVLRNLLSNGAKYSGSGTPLELRAVRQGDHVRISVVDHGFGIHPDDLARIFEKFGRGRDEEGRRIPGVGLGLYLSRRIVQAHGSDLSVESQLGLGSTFSFDLEVFL